MNVKRYPLVGLLALEAFVLLVLCWAGNANQGWFSGALAFPFEQLGAGLRALSLAGAMGNVLSILLYAALCLLPAAGLLVIRRKRPLYREDGLLALLTVLLFVVMYYMVNPSLVPVPHGLIDGMSYKSLFGGAVYALLFGYGVLRLLGRFVEADRSKLQGYLFPLLEILAVLFIYLAFGACFQDLLTSLDALREGNRGNEGALMVSYGFLFLRWLAAALPYVLDVAVILAALDLLEAMQVDPYSQVVVTTVGKLSRLCVGNLAVTVLVTVALNLLQFLFLGELYTLHVTVYLPVLSVAFVLGVLLLAQFIGESRQLKEDNDLFI